jgi:hypothetical protein
MKIVLYLLFSLGAACSVKAQNFGLRILTVSDSSQITSEMQLFDSLFYQCIQDYGKKDISSLFTANASNVSKTHPITVLNFITGIDVPLNYVFPFKLVKSISVNDSISIIQLDMGWMQLALPLNRNQKKLMRFESLNNFGLRKFEYKNLVIYSTEEVKRRDAVKAYSRIVVASKEIGVNLKKFNAKTYTMYSANSIAEAYAYVGGLQNASFFYPGSRYGGMGDPYNNVILSGISTPIHVHELLHFVIDFPCNLFINEGLASYYGGISSGNYETNIKSVLGIVAENDIHTFQGLYNLQISNASFNSVRGLYVLSAYLLNRVKKDFGLKEYQLFIRICKTDQEMINSLKALYKLNSEQAVFNYFFQIYESG